MASIPYIGKCFPDAKSFLEYLDSIQFGAWRPQFVTMHHTGAPSLKQWDNWQTRAVPVTDQQWMANLAAYYGNEMRWSSGPQFFFTPKNFCVLSPPTKRGVHAVSFNAMSWGVEVVGNFDVEPFTDNLLGRYAEGLACLHLATDLELEPFVFQKRGLHFHRDDPKTNKTCPGKNVSKDKVIAATKAHLKRLAGDGDTVEEQVDEKTVGAFDGITTVDDLNVRASATAKAPIVTVLEKGTPVRIIGKAMNGTTEWYQTYNGWVAARYVTVR